jgi:hypothetical protein
MNNQQAAADVLPDANQKLVAALLDIKKSKSKP